MTNDRDEIQILSAHDVPVRTKILGRELTFLPMMDSELDQYEAALQQLNDHKALALAALSAVLSVLVSVATSGWPTTAPGSGVLTAVLMLASVGGVWSWARYRREAKRLLSLREFVRQRAQPS